MARGKGDGDYKVGYGRPPEETRFRKGQSGNPKGRPKGAKNLGGLFQRMLGEAVNVREGERTRSMSKVEAMLQNLLLKAIKGETRSIAQVLALISVLLVTHGRRCQDAIAGAQAITRCTRARTATPPRGIFPSGHPRPDPYCRNGLERQRPAAAR